MPPWLVETLFSRIEKISTHVMNVLLLSLHPHFTGIVTVLNRNLFFPFCSSSSSWLPFPALLPHSFLKKFKLYIIPSPPLLLFSCLARSPNLADDRLGLGFFDEATSNISFKIFILCIPTQRLDASVYKSQ